MEFTEIYNDTVSSVSQAVRVGNVEQVMSIVFRVKRADQNFYDLQKTLIGCISETTRKTPFSVTFLELS
jgi:hypothetical protein